MPFFMLYGLASVVYVLMYYVVRYRRKVVYGNLRRSFPQWSAAELERNAKLFYKNLADVTMESLKGMTISEAELRRRVVYTNPELVNGYTLQGLSTISLTSHKCNWEWLLLGSTLNFGVTPVDSLYKPLSSGFMDKLMLRVRTRFGAHMIPDLKVLRELAVRKGMVRTIALVADQTPAMESPHRHLFLNQPTLFFAGPERIATAVQLPVLFADMNRVKRGYYTVTCYKMCEPPYDKADPGIVAKYVEVCEAAILRQPWNWLWSHKRWKHEVRY